MHLIGLMGRCRSGKDTVASILMDLLQPNPYELVHIADGLKAAMRMLYGLHPSQLHGQSKDICDPRYGQSPRDICTLWGKFLMQTHGADFLTQRMFSQYDPRITSPGWIVADVRYQHDIDAIHRRGGVVWKVERTSLPFKLEQEAHIDNLLVDGVIRNNADLGALRTEIIEHMEQHRKTHKTHCI